MSYNEIITQGTKTNQIGNFVSLSVGAGNTVLKAAGNYLWAGSSNASSAPFTVNRQTGVLSATGANISGIITATGGSITGDINVTGNIYAGSSSGSQVQLKGSDGKLKFLRSGSEKGAIYVDSSNRLQFSANGSDGMYFNSSSQLYVKNDIYVTNGTVYAYNDIFSGNGSVYGYNDVYSTHGSVWAQNDVYSQSGHVKSHTYMEAGSYITAGGDIYSSGGSIHGNYDIYTDGGSIRAYNDIYSTNGKVKCADKFVCKGKEGQDSNYTVVTWIDFGKQKFYTHDLKFVGGIFTGESSQSTH